MIFERRLEAQTKGIVCGPPLLVSKDHEVYSLGIAKRSLFLTSSALDHRPQTLHYKIVIRAVEGGEVLWVRPFATKTDALHVYAQLIGIDLDRAPDQPVSFPGTWRSGELEYVFATVVTFNSSVNNSGLDWNAGGSACPAGVTATDYLAVAGAGSGGSSAAGFGGAGGGGSGGLQSGAALAVTPTTNYPVVIGAGGSMPAAGNTIGNDGADSTFSSVTALKGGAGASVNQTPGGGSGTYGSGGGVGFQGTSITGGAGTAGQGNNGGNGSSGSGQCGAGGGGTSAVGTNANSGSNGVAGGAGTSSSITGSAVTYGGGGGSGGYNGGSGGAGGSGGGGAGGNGSPANGTAGTANLGGGGGGAGTTAGAGAQGGAGGSGVVILSFTQIINYPFRRIRNYIQFKN